MVRIIKAAMGYAAIPAGFPILVSERMAIIEPAFAWLLELATIPGRSQAAETVRTYGEHLHDWFDSLERSGPRVGNGLRRFRKSTGRPCRIMTGVIPSKGS